jgi:hypothetical protein
MTARYGAIADGTCILVLPTNFIVLVSSGFRVAPLQQKENKSNSSRMRSTICLAAILGSTK